MTEEEANISQAVEESCGCPLANLPNDSVWLKIYDELIKELHDSNKNSYKVQRQGADNFNGAGRSQISE
jgi:hypothetical protein